jgi:hypothetical protein
LAISNFGNAGFPRRGHSDLAFRSVSSVFISGKVTAVSRKPAHIKVINLEEGMPTVEQARLRMEHELHSARRQRCAAVKLIHGYGSSGTGGALRIELQKELRRMAQAGVIRAFIAGDDWRVSDEVTWELLRRFPEWKQDSDLGKSNKGISIVVF